MNKTKKAIRHELKNIFEDVLSQLGDEQKLMTKEEKNELRNFLEELNEAKIHIYSHVLIQKKIIEILRKRNNKTQKSLVVIDDVHYLENKIESIPKNHLKKTIDELLKTYDIEDIKKVLEQIKKDNDKDNDKIKKDNDKDNQK